MPETQVIVHDERAEIMRRFVSGINCQPDTARDEMMAKHGIDTADQLVSHRDDASAQIKELSNNQLIGSIASVGVRPLR